MKTKLKYGENPDQKATATHRVTADALAITRFRREDGKPFVGSETSWISITDLGRLLQVVERFAAAYKKNIGPSLPHVAAIVKHGSPCGAAFGGNPERVAHDTWLGDPQAAFGGSLIVTFPFTTKIAEALAKANGGKMPFLSAIAAPSFEKGVTNKIMAKSKGTHFIYNKALAKIPARLSSQTEIKSVRDYVLEQAAPRFVPVFSRADYHGPEFSEKDMNEMTEDLTLAYAVCSASTSNTVTVVLGGVLIGNAVGQQKRVGSARLALRLAHESGHATKGAVAVSDSYFPFPDGAEALAEGGVRAIYATSGSMRDNFVFARAKELGVGMFTVPDKVGRMFAGH
jgi:phosphoribosylaminoimidazolecarboxamide formyltransferase / IMP cyclohydrolase